MSVPCIHGCPDYRACGRCQRTLTIQQARMNRTSPRAQLRGAGRSGTSGRPTDAGPPGQGTLPGLGDQELDAARDLAAREAAERARRVLADIQAARARRQAQAGQEQARATRALLAETMAHLRTTQAGGRR